MAVLEDLRPAMSTTKRSTREALAGLGRLASLNGVIRDAAVPALMREAQQLGNREPRRAACICGWSPSFLESVAHPSAPSLYPKGET